MSKVAYLRMIGALAKITALIAVTLMFLLMIITFLDVVGRNLIGQPLQGASELTELALAVIIFLTLPRITARDMHIKIDLIANICGPRLLFTLDIFAGLLGAVFFAAVAWRMWSLGNGASTFGDTSPTLAIPLAPILYGISILAGINAIVYTLAISNPNKSKDRLSD